MGAEALQPVPKGALMPGALLALRWPARVREEAVSGLEALNPAYFAMVMATGIVAIAACWAGIPVVPSLLAWLNLGLFACLLVLTALRVLYFPRAVFRDLSDHKRGPGFFTLVAATCVLGRQTMTIWGDSRFAVVLWLIAVPLLVLLTYAIFTALTVKEEKPTLDAGIHG